MGPPLRSCGMPDERFVWGLGGVSIGALRDSGVQAHARAKAVSPCCQVEELTALMGGGGVDRTVWAAAGVEQPGE